MRRISIRPTSFYIVVTLFFWVFAVPTYAQFDTQRVINNQSLGANDVQAADLDGDDDLDIIVASPDNNQISWHENTDGFGAYGFQRVISNEVQRVNAIHCADVNGDGHVDILSASRDDNSIGWHPNRGDGIFDRRQVISNALFVAMSVFTADLDGDGDLDILSASRDDNKIAWYEQTSPGVFGAQQVISTMSFNAFVVYAADLDGDGDIDVLSASGLDDKIAWYENLDGLGTFSEQLIISASADAARDVIAADIDNDGDMDVVSASAGDHKIAWYRNENGSGSFSGEIVLTRSALFARSVHVADVDVDGDLDVLAASSNDSTLAWYPNLDGLGNFGEAFIIDDQAAGASSIVAANLDNDEDMDVISTASFNNTVTAYESFAGRGRVRFRFMSEIAAGPSETNWPHSVHAADVDGDGDLDLMTASFLDNKISWYENVRGVFGEQQVVTQAADGARDVQTADLDGDGDLDIISASGVDNAIKWYENFNGRGSFDILREVTTSANNAYAVYPADLDGDGDIDIVSASFDDDTIAWYENLDGKGVFGPLISITKAAKGATDVLAIDMDNDGDIDVVSASSFDDKVAWYRNVDGMGTFDEQIIISEDVDLATSVHAADVDLDGDMDILSASGGDDKISWHENLDGMGTFGQGKIVTLEADRAFSVYAADLDGDNDPDAISASRDDNRIAWYENLGDGRFGVQQTISSSIIGARSVIAVDLDSDGDPDVISASQDGNRVVWYENRSLVPTVLDAEDEIVLEEIEHTVSVFPNPMNNTGYLKVGVQHSQQVAITVYDIQGREVERLFRGYLLAGQERTLQFDRSTLPAGVYMIRILGERFARTQKVVLVR